MDRIGTFSIQDLQSCFQDFRYSDLVIVVTFSLKQIKNDDTGP